MAQRGCVILRAGLTSLLLYGQVKLVGDLYVRKAICMSKRRGLSPWLGVDGVFGTGYTYCIS